jgi:hypothetical protein
LFDKVVGMTVPFPVDAATAFDYLADPRNRPEWQSSLRAVEMIDAGPARQGMRWVDVTRPGLRPRMEIVGFRRADSWAERGTWHRVTALLELIFEPTEDGCVVHAIFGIGLPFVPHVVDRLVERMAAPAVRDDLRRAARLLSERASGH